MCKIKGFCSELGTILVDKVSVADSMPNNLADKPVTMPDKLIIHFAFDKSELNANAKIDNWVNESEVYLEQSLDKKDKEIDRLILQHFAQRKHLLNYLSFGTATKSEKDDLKMISGIGPYIEEGLNALDIYIQKIMAIVKFVFDDFTNKNCAYINGIRAISLILTNHYFP